ncbi:MAG: YmdB family metallophosphoesterase [Alphaproteobacteria bacterium]|jgi:2',3'-cyclic-nucleotide 2'-phosphodiesterase|nr:MAG: YmdB family metallophosphoesterase [Alphaproteobacteria bacterium]
MRLGFFGDVVGRAGRAAVAEHLPRVRKQLKLDFVVVNGENSAGGFGITSSTANELFDAGADCITLGNHSWDQAEALTFIERETRLLRPFNYPQTLNIPGRGAQLFTTPNGQRVFVIQIHGSAFMESLDDPIQGVQRALDEAPLRQVADAVIVEMHAEATAEKYIMGHFCDGRATLVVGAHTHVPTGDAHILSNGTAYMTDAGMCGDYDSVIGMKKGPLVQRASTRLPVERKSPAEGPATMCGVVVESDDNTGLAVRVAPIRVGGKLAQTLPDLDG